MGTDPGPAGSIFRYPYLWLAQRDAGEESGRKDRPVCLVLKVRDDPAGLTHLALLAISSKQPMSHQVALEIPEMERRRAGLDAGSKAWVYVSEWNYDIAERSFYLEPTDKPLGSFTPRFLSLVAKAFLPTMRSRIGKVDRAR